MVQAAFDNGKRVNPYLKQKILTASPEQLVVYIFDAAIIACSQADKIKSIEAIQLLIGSIKFDHVDIATNFYNTYGAIVNLIKKEDFLKALEHLNEIKSTWKRAMNLS